MRKTRYFIVLVAGLVTVLGSGGWLWRSRYVDKPLSCIGNMEWSIGSNRSIGMLSFRMYNSEGLATITGKLYGHNTSNISRSIYLNYTQKCDTRVLQAMQVIKTFADTADEADTNDTLPGFYRQSGRSLNLVIEEYKDVWIFANSNVSSLYCCKR